METRKKLRYVLLCAVMLLSAVLCAGCGDSDKPAFEDYFSASDKKQWKKDERSCRHTMNGGYFLYYKGEYYPVEFDDGELWWVSSEDYTVRSEKLVFAKLERLYTDKNCKKPCAYLGSYEEWALLGSGPSWTGYILEGNRPSYGSVLYVDDTEELKTVLNDRGKRYAPDEVITSSVVLKWGYEFLTNEDGTLKEHVNTPRKLFAYMMEACRAENGKIQWNESEQHTLVRSLGAFSLKQSSRNTKIDLGGWTKDESYAVSERYLSLGVTDVSIADGYNIYLDYQCEGFAPKHFMLFTSLDEAKRFTDKIQNDDRYTNIELNGDNVVYRYFHVENNEEVIVVHSIAAFNQILEKEMAVDSQQKKALAYFTRYPQNPDMKFDGKMDYYLDTYYHNYQFEEFMLYAVWEDYRTVQLHTPDSVLEVVVSEHNDAVLPRPLYPNHEFVGWYADESYSGQPITTLTNASGYENLYAKFREVDHYTLTFEPHDGKTVESIQYVYGEEFTLPMLTKAFHIFKGWYTDPDCKTEPITAISTELYGSYHLYPCFEARKYTVTLHYGEQVKDIQVAYGAEFATTWGVTEAGFLGYFDENGVQYTDENGKSLTPFTDGADIQLFAKYKEEST